MTLVTFEQTSEAKALDEERRSLLDFLHRLGEMDSDGEIAIEIPAEVDGYVEQAVIEKGKAGPLVAALVPLVTARVEQIDAEIRALGIEPSVWSPPEELPDVEDDEQEEAA